MKHIRKSISLTTFINENRAELIAYIKTVCTNCTDFSDNGLREWVNNDETIYNWAISEGVKNP